MHVPTVHARSPVNQAARDPILAEILEIVAHEFNLTVHEMMAAGRRHEVWKPRIAAVYFARLLTPLSLIELGDVFGGRRHTTMLRAFRRCRALIERDANWSQRMDRLLARLVETTVLPRAM